jgi:hypothetical protein
MKIHLRKALQVSFKDEPLILILLGSVLVSEAARKALWACLVDEPTLLIRFFFEKLSHKERRVNIDTFFSN